MDKIIVLLILILLTPTIFASCEKNQIDINSASKTELDKLDGIGPVKADAIINARPFDSVDDLIKVYGIGEATLGNIKNQGLACVEDEKKESADKKINEPENKSNETKLVLKDEENPETVMQPIRLKPKDIKSDGNSENNKVYAIYGFMVFCVLLTLYFLKFRRKDGLE